jgi:hypothetical protein
MANFDAPVDSISTVIENIKDSLKHPFQQVSSTETTPSGPHAGRGRGGRHSCDGCGGHGGRGGCGSQLTGEPWTEAITARWYQGHDIARMSGAQCNEMRAQCSERHEQCGPAISAVGQVLYYIPPPPPYPPSMVHLPPPPPPMTHVSALHSNLQHPALQGPRGHALLGYPLTSVTGSYGGSVAPNYPGQPGGSGYPGYPGY